MITCFFCFFFGYLRNTLQNSRELRSHSLKKWMSKCTNNSCPKLKHSYHLLLQIQEPRIVQSTLSSKNLYFHCSFLALAIIALKKKKNNNLTLFLKCIVDRLFDQLFCSGGILNSWAYGGWWVWVFFFPLSTDQRCLFLFHLPCPELWVSQLPAPQPLPRNAQSLPQKSDKAEELFLGTRQQCLQQACCASPLTPLSFFLSV